MPLPRIFLMTSCFTRLLIALLFLSTMPPSAWAAAAKPEWVKFENCTLAEGYADGDSFLVQLPSGDTTILRLYFVDCPETSTDTRFPERIQAQADYFHTDVKAILAVGDAAKAFTKSVLSEPFTVWICNQKAPGASKKPRYYAMVQTANGQWLSSRLVQAGLARIYGKRISLPTGEDSRTHLARLAAFESAARRAQLGGWKR